MARPRFVGWRGACHRGSLWGGKSFPLGCFHARAVCAISGEIAQAVCAISTEIAHAELRISNTMHRVRSRKPCSLKDRGLLNIFDTGGSLRAYDGCNMAYGLRTGRVRCAISGGDRAPNTVQRPGTSEERMIAHTCPLKLLSVRSFFCERVEGNSTCRPLKGGTRMWGARSRWEITHRTR